MHSVGVLTPWEYEFSIDTNRKRKITEKQRAVRVRINGKILSAVSNTMSPEQLKKRREEIQAGIRARMLERHRKPLEEG
jgi:hypothetical protein